MSFSHELKERYEQIKVKEKELKHAKAAKWVKAELETVKNLLRKAVEKGEDTMHLTSVPPDLAEEICILFKEHADFKGGPVAISVAGLKDDQLFFKWYGDT